MFCPKCGANISDTARFCTNCGNDMTAHTQDSAALEQQAPVDNEWQPQVIEEPVRSYVPAGEGAPKNNKGLIVTLIAIIAVLVAALIGIGAYLVISDTAGIFSKEEIKTCAECGDGFEGNGNLCDICKEKEEKTQKCEECGAEFEGEGTLCAECKVPKKECNQCGNKMEGEALLCENCIGEIDYIDNYEYGDLSCFNCGTSIEEIEVAIVDADGFVFCKSCDTGNYCLDCNMPIKFDDDDTACQYCADFVCKECEEILTEEEVAGKNEEEGYYYCENCWYPSQEL